MSTHTSRLGVGRSGHRRWGTLRWTSLLVMMSTALTVNSSTVGGQEPSPDTPLAGGFRIDFGDSPGENGEPAAAKQPRTSTDDVVRSLLRAEAGRQDEAGLPTPDQPVAGIPPGLQRPDSEFPKTARKTPPGGTPIAAQSSPPKGPATLIQAGDMIGFSRELGDGVQAITIINASRRWMAVYHIDSSGQIRLTSSRPLDADFTIQFNATAPLPEDIRRLQGK